ncbi:DUF2931 family protein [Teredinibacter waterburyi]|uniref:DUF2931 family protein n=1 Tax=Teredinibacter waterburyi TaxID=1500538 RepID=UPI001CAA844D|nr:DUF2931 family protein [Teredinibacter waterburyi]
MAKFEWLPGDSAPTQYPMRVLKGILFLADDNFVLVPDSASINRGWGIYKSTLVIGDPIKAIPKTLTITFFSYTEDCFYQGSFDLPYDELLSLFQQGFYSVHTQKKQNYTRITVGVAPGGAVAVWAAGVGKRTLVFYDKAQKADLPWSTLTKNTEIPREQYIRNSLSEDLSEAELEKLAIEGVPEGLIDRRHKTYTWMLDFNSVKPIDIFYQVEFFNGEADYFLQPLRKTMTEKPHPAPQKLHTFWMDANGNRRSSEIEFDPDFIIPAFEKLSALAGDEPIVLTLNTDESRRGKVVEVYLSRQYPNPAKPEQQLEAREDVGPAKLENYSTHLEIENFTHPDLK